MNQAVLDKPQNSIGNGLWAIDTNFVQQFVNMEYSLRTDEEMNIQYSANGETWQALSYDEDDESVVAPMPFRIVGGAALIKIVGMTFKREDDLLSYYFNVPTYQGIERQIKLAMGNDDVEGIVLDVESPGGIANGIDRLATIIRQSTEKPIVAYANGLMASAAYYFSSGATQIVASPDALIGSIGVVMHHLEISKMNQMQGITYTRIAKPEDKGAGGINEPLSQDRKEMLQGLVDDHADMFVEAVSVGRKLTEESIREEIGARIFTAEQAIENDLIDEIGEIERAIDIALS